MAFRVGRRAFVLGAAAAGLAACDRTRPMPENFATPWREETGEAARLFSQYTHGFDEGVALSPEGGLFAATLYGAPVNELTLIDLKARNMRVLADADRRLRLARPAFSPDGKSLVVVRAAPPTYSGLSELVIVDLATGEGRVIGERVSYAWPTFAPDGKSLVYWGDSRGRPTSRMQPEYREFVDFALFRMDLASGVETRLDPRTFNAAWEIVALADGRVLFNANGDTTDWPASGTADVECFAALKGARAYAATSIPSQGCRPSVIASDDPLLHHANLRGATADGRLLLKNGRDEPALQTFAVLWDGTTATFVAPPPPGVQEPAISLDGSTVAGVMYDNLIDPKGARTLKTQIFVQDLASGAQAVFDPPAPSGRLTLTAATGL